MTSKEFIAKLWGEGFTTHLMWSAKTGTQRSKYDDIRCYIVHAPNGALLTSLIIREIDDGGFGTFYANESLSAESDFQRLRDMALAVEAKQAASRPAA